MNYLVQQSTIPLHFFFTKVEQQTAKTWYMVRTRTQQYGHYLISSIKGEQGRKVQQYAIFQVLFALYGLFLLFFILTSFI